MQPWKLKEDYLVQDQRYQAICARYDDAVLEADVKLQELRAKQAELLTQEFMTGTDTTVDKKKLNAKITEAEKALAAATAERTQAYDYSRGASATNRISVRDLLLDWSGPYRQSVRENELNPIIDRMTAAKDAYLNALLDVKQLEARYQAAYQELHSLASTDNANHPGNYMYPNTIISNSDLPLITREDVLLIESRQVLPEGILRIKGDV